MRLATVARAWMALALVASPAGAETPAPADRAALGRKIDNFTAVDVHGQPRSLADLGDKELVVIAFMGTECPLARLYAPRLRQLAEEYAAKNVAFIAVDSNDQDSLTEMARFATEQGWPFGFWKDNGQNVADRFAVERQPTVYVLDRERVVRYQGRIDDQYGLGASSGYARPEVKRRDLALALDELLAGADVSHPSTPVTGCRIGRRPKGAGSGSVTYSRHVAPLLAARCVSCHRAGEIGPFALTDYDEVVPWAEMIREVVTEGRMPPWGANPDFGHFANDPRLSDSEKNLLDRWIDDGCPRGDPRDQPPGRVWTAGWQIDEPDQIVRLPKPYRVRAEGTLAYQYFLVDPGRSEDKWIAQAEVRPGNRAVVHHILVGFVPPSLKLGQKPDDGGPAPLTSFVPGSIPHVYPPGTAAFVPARSRLMFEIHYTPNGIEQEDQSYLGVVFADPATVTRRAIYANVESKKFTIPAGARDHELVASRLFDRPCLLLSLSPHMHLRGKSFRFEAAYPDGAHEILLDVPRYDFNWQLRYELAEPKRLPAGTRLVCTARYDNSAANLANPAPDKDVHFGWQTDDEMLAGFFTAVPLAADVPSSPPPALPRFTGADTMR